MLPANSLLENPVSSVNDFYGWLNNRSMQFRFRLPEKHLSWEMLSGCSAFRIEYPGCLQHVSFQVLNSSIEHCSRVSIFFFQSYRKQGNRATGRQYLQAIVDYSCGEIKRIPAT